MYGPKTLSRETIKERFELKVVRTVGCWGWSAAKDDRGYGVMTVVFGRPTRLTKAHRVSWFLEYGWWVGGDLEVCHRCNNSECSNPEHLYVATHSINMRDAVRDGLLGGNVRPGYELKIASPYKKNRPGNNAGVNNGSNCRLTELDVREIRAICKRGELTKIAKRLNITIDHACRIRKGKKWKHLL